MMKVTTASAKSFFRVSDKRCDFVHPCSTDYTYGYWVRTILVLNGFVEKDVRTHRFSFPCSNQPCVPTIPKRPQDGTNVRMQKILSPVWRGKSLGFQFSSTEVCCKTQNTRLSSFAQTK